MWEFDRFRLFVACNRVYFVSPRKSDAKTFKWALDPIIFGDTSNNLTTAQLTLSYLEEKKHDFFQEDMKRKNISRSKTHDLNFFNNQKKQQANIQDQ